MAHRKFGYQPFSSCLVAASEGSVAMLFCSSPGHQYRKMPEEQAVQGLHRAGASAARVWPLPQALWKIPGVLSGELHHMDQVCRVGDHPGGHGQGPCHLWVGHWAATTGHAWGQPPCHITPMGLPWFQIISFFLFEFWHFRCFGSHTSTLKSSRRSIRIQESFTRDCYSAHSMSRWGVSLYRNHPVSLLVIILWMHWPGVHFSKA